MVNNTSRGVLADRDRRMPRSFRRCMDRQPSAEQDLCRQNKLQEPGALRVDLLDRAADPLGGGDLPDAWDGG